MTTASFNYTGRKRINRRQFQVTREVSNPEFEVLELGIWVDQKLLDTVQDYEAIVLDVMQRGHERFVLKCIESQKVHPEYSPKGSAPRYRLSIVDVRGENPGKIRLSSDELRLAPLTKDANNSKKMKPETQLRECKETFFSPEESDELGSQLWKVDLSDPGEIQIYINTRLLEIYDGDKHDPVLRGYILPAMVRELFNGVFMRAADMESLQDTNTEKWFKWAQHTMGEANPTGPFSGDSRVTDEWLDWLDQLVEKFTAEKIVDGRYSLLEAMEEHGNA